MEMNGENGLKLNTAIKEFRLGVLIDGLPMLSAPSGESLRPLTF